MEIATPLRDLADKLDSDGDVTLDRGGTIVTVNPTDPVPVMLEGESDWSREDSEAKQSIAFELVWWRETATSAGGN